ncbi:MAG: transketolase [Bacteroidetes bacterium]|nr:transketolase [Bacteroidota bacterium]
MCYTLTNDLEKLGLLARAIRQSVVRSLAEAGSGHLGGSLGSADIFTALYFSVIRHTPDEPLWPGRDRFILSIGHIAPVLYATLAEAGYFRKEELLSLRKLGSRLQGHPGRDHQLPGLELSAGSLGQGLSVSVGMALALKMDRLDNRVYCLCGDGELQEGSVWEAAMSAAHHKLNNLTVIIDRNSLQIDGSTEKVMALEPLKKKWEAFGWQALECDGHDFRSLLPAFNKARMELLHPSVIIAKTVMGKGIASIEGDYRWHGKAPTKEQAVAFLRELEGGIQNIEH